MASTVLSGVKEDVELMIYNFVSQKHQTFCSFSLVWKEMQFHHIFSGRPTVIEMRYFIRELLLIVKSYAISKYTKWERSGAIFLLYALYFTQPLTQKVQIRIEQHEWVELRKFCEAIRSINDEVTFCFCKLVIHNAFDFCFSNKQYTIGSMKEDDPSKHTKSEPVSMKQKKYKYDKFAMGALLTSIGFDPSASSERENKYNEIKSLLNQKFPDLCTFEERKFAVNLLVPSYEESSSDQQKELVEENPAKPPERKKSKKKVFNLNELSLFLRDDKIIDSTLSMPSFSPCEGEDSEDNQVDDPVNSSLHSD